MKKVYSRKIQSWSYNCSRGSCVILSQYFPWIWDWWIGIAMVCRCIKIKNFITEERRKTCKHFPTKKSHHVLCPILMMKDKKRRRTVQCSIQRGLKGWLIKPSKSVEKPLPFFLFYVETFVCKAFFSLI